jgi:hypothetical protein
MPRRDTTRPLVIFDEIHKYRPLDVHARRTGANRRTMADFLIAEGRKPLLLIETKFADEQPSKALIAIQRQIGVPAVQLVRDADTYRTLKSDSLPLLVAPAWAWLAGVQSS